MMIRAMLIMHRVKIENVECIWLASLNAMQIEISIAVAYDFNQLIYAACSQPQPLPARRFRPLPRTTLFGPAPPCPAPPREKNLPRPLGGFLFYLFSEIIFLHAPKFCHLPQGFQNCFCFCSTTFPSHVGTFFGFNGKMTKINKMAINHFSGVQNDSQSV